MVRSIFQMFSLQHDDMLVPAEALMGLTRESEYVKEKRQQAVAFLRSFSPSKYVLDGANVSWRNHTALGLM